MNSAALKKEDINNKFMNIFCTLYLSDTEFAINVNSIQEVVNVPENIIKMPLSPKYLVGIFNLRQLIIPIIDLSLLIEFDSQLENKAKKVAIIDIEGVKIGLLFDATGEVLRISNEVRNDFNYNNESAKKIISGVLKLNESRLLQIINCNELINIENIPQILDYQHKYLKENNLKIKESRKKCISFTVNKIKLALEIDGIYEIVKVDKINQSTLKHELCLGHLTIRNLIVPLIDFAKVLHTNANESSEELGKRAIILKICDSYLALRVDSVDSINTFTDASLIPVPILFKERSKIIKGSISFQDMGDVLMLNHLEILSNKEIEAITNGHSKLYSAENNLVQNDKRKIARQSIVTFRATTLFGFPLIELKEIINRPDSFIEAPGMPESVLGMINLRGRLVLIVDLRILYHLEKVTDLTHEKVIIINSGNDLIGFLVDSVDSIIQIDHNNKMKFPEILINKNGVFHQDIKEIVEINIDGSKPKGLIILDHNKVLTRLENLNSSVSIKDISKLEDEIFEDEVDT